jgi:signal transduction histidine kinase
MKTELETQAAQRTSELRRIEAHLQNALRLAETAYWVLDFPAGRLHYWPTGLFPVLAKDDETSELDVATWRSRIHPEDREAEAAIVDEAITHNRPYDIEYRMAWPDGRLHVLRSLGRPSFDDRGEVVRYMGIVTDVTRQRKMERTLRRARERAITARFDARLEERNRIARDLHDTLLQGFTGVSLELLAVTNSLHAPAEEIAALREVIALAQQTLTSARQAIFDIRTPLPPGDLPATIRNTAWETIRGTGLELVVSTRGAVRPLPDAVESAIIRVGTELATNAAKHSGGTRLRVCLLYGRRNVSIRVTDNGRGFVVDSEVPGHAGHLGLLGIRERVTQLGGACEIRSEPGKGTSIKVMIPTRRRR